MSSAGSGRTFPLEALPTYAKQLPSALHPDNYFFLGHAHPPLLSSPFLGQRLPPPLLSLFLGQSQPSLFPCHIQRPSPLCVGHFHQLPFSSRFLDHTHPPPLSSLFSGQSRPSLFAGHVQLPSSLFSGLLRQPHLFVSLCLQHCQWIGQSQTVQSTTRIPWLSMSSPTGFQHRQHKRHGP